MPEYMRISVQGRVALVNAAAIESIVPAPAASSLGAQYVLSLLSGEYFTLEAAEYAALLTGLGSISRVVDTTRPRPSVVYPLPFTQED